MGSWFSGFFYTIAQHAVNQSSINQGKMKKIKVFGKEFSLLLFVGILIAVGASATLLTYYGSVTASFNVEQSILLDDEGWPDSQVTDVIPEGAPGGETFCFPHELTNQMSVEGTVDLETEYTPDGDGITTTFVQPLAYSFSDSQDVDDGTVGQLVTTVEEDGDWMVWTFDFPVEQLTGNGNLAVGLVIADGEKPLFQVHNNDGADSAYDWGTWLYSEWGPTIGDGWNGWHTGTGGNNQLVSGISWIEAIGQRNTPFDGLESGDGVLQIRIKKSELGDSFNWAASPTAAGGFFEASDVTMQLPAGFDWAIPLVDMDIPNYIPAELVGPLSLPVTIASQSTEEFSICYEFAPEIMPRTYTITTNVVPE